ncbi:MAG TPA: SEL1-like repeat protein [Candidatus Cybelea sp.]|nr:SEL1-like repeat protein [Candidatus Cybelea sp.]
MRAFRVLLPIALLLLGACGTSRTPDSAAHPPTPVPPAKTEADWRNAYRDGVRSLEGREVPQDDAKAASLLADAANHAISDAQFLLGLLYDTGRGVPNDPVSAAVWYRKAAEQGHRDAQFLLGLAYYRGRGVARNDPDAAAWFTAAAVAHQAGAAYHLGIVNLLGRGVPRDDVAALKWLQQAADQDYPEAQYLVGLIYANGHGVPRDLAWAARWYGKAAEQGLTRAQYALALALAAGLGVSADAEEALRWASLAAEHGDPEAMRLRTDLRERVTPHDRFAVGQWVRGWLPVAGHDVADRPTIRYVQTVLGRLGFDPGPPDGVLGPRTKLAITQYRSQNGASGDEVLNQDLVDRLRADANGRNKS